MALGFGFNKTKVLASAEKYVQQGKLQNAIADYEKVVKEDPHDLTVLNTIGDLNSRLGKNDQAALYFKKVGEAYATNGFTVKAIAMYKKLTKLTPAAMDVMLRLAELYTVQGLYNDARSQYVHVADGHLKSGNNDEAANVFQKILELDPDNTAMQTKLADLYIKLGKKTEARNIFFTAAQSLYAKQSMEAATEALSQVLTLDPKNVDALLLRGTIAAESGDGNTALQLLTAIPDVESSPDALRSLLRAHLSLKNFEEARRLVAKLITEHNDAHSLSWYGETLLAADQADVALESYEEFYDKLAAANPQGLTKFLNAAVSKVKEGPDALERLRRMFHKAGDNSHEAELLELLAHAYVQANELHKAKDIYQQLAQSEPENPMHAQNYKQVVARLGEDAAAMPLSDEQGAQALMMEELDHKAPVIHQTYSDDVEKAVQSAIADSELFDSYNLPDKAVGPLEAGLNKAPRDFQINQRLSAIYPGMKRYADAARACTILKELYLEGKNSEEAQKYSDLASKYLALAPEGVSVGESQAAAEPAEFGFAVETPEAEASSVNLLNLHETAPPEPTPMAPPATATGSHELDMDQWESMLSVDSPAEPVSQPPAFEVPAAVADSTPQEFEVTPTSGMDASASVTEFGFESSSIDAPVTEPATVEAAAEAVSIEEAPSQGEPVFEIQLPSTDTGSFAEAASISSPEPPQVPEVVAAAKTVAAPSDDLLGDLVSDLEDSLGDNFAFGGKTAAQTKSVSAPTAMASAAAASVTSGSATAPLAVPTPAPIDPDSVPAGFSSMGHEMPAEAPEIANQEATSVLSDMFSEFKEDAEESAGEAEDPDTHYNLGIAFKEMGLLDEAIGELQKVCHAIDRGLPFEQGMQAYTWLAQCLVDKGVPQAAVRWYEKALRLKNLTEDGRLAVNYDLACAHEMAGNPKKAYETFMEVYGSNIDYRDVSDRIKSLKV